MASSNLIMKRCCKCHIDKPATPGYFQRKKSCKDGLYPQCKSCCKEYRDSHKEQRSASFKDWRNRNRESEIERSRQFKIDNPDYHHLWYLSHAEETKIRGRQWRENHPEHVRYRGLKYRIKYPLKHKTWKEQNRDKVRVSTEKRNARKCNLPNTLTAEEWQCTLEYFNHTCAVCGRCAGDGIIIALDHWIPLSADISDNPGTVACNIVPLCHGVGGCNNEKKNRMPQKWLYNKYDIETAEVILNRIQSYLISKTP